MSLTVWHGFLTRESENRCEAYLRRHLGYRGTASLVQVCLRHMQATERPACSLEVIAGRIRVGNPPSWTAGMRSLVDSPRRDDAISLAHRRARSGGRRPERLGLRIS